MKFKKIKSLKRVKGEKIYHITIRKNHNFFGNNLLLHNCDYFSNPDNDGNIGICLRNIGTKTQTIFTGDRIAQGIFMKYQLADDIISEEERKGGIGSTNE